MTKTPDSTSSTISPSAATSTGTVPSCPSCGDRGKPVPLATLKSLIKPEFQPQLTEGPYRFCRNPECDVVYFASDGPQTFNRTALKVRVGLKEKDPPRPLCYCFGHTAEEIIDEIRRTGQTMVPERIQKRLEEEGCDCLHKNPQGTCCLGSVNAFVAEALRLYSRENGSTGRTIPG